MEEVEEAKDMQGVVGGRRANGTDRARRPQADKEGQGAEGTSKAEGRLEGQWDQRDPVPMRQRDPVPMGEISPTLKWTKKSGLGTKMDMKSTKFSPFGLKLAASTLTFSCESNHRGETFR